MHEMIAELRRASDLKVWSLLVTLFGDMAMAEDARLSGPALREMLAPLDIQPEAVRVALHRLRKDGWIVADRQGRIGYYCLSPWGRAQTQSVSPRIYGTTFETRDSWFLVVQPDADTAPKQALHIGPGRFLCPEPSPYPALSAPWQGTVPDWVKTQILPRDLDPRFTELWALLSRPVEAPSSLQEAVVLRLLILHHWRRLVLRTPPLAESLLGMDWSGARCRTQVQVWLSALPVPTNDSIQPTP